MTRQIKETESVQLRDVLRPIVKWLIKQGISEDSIPRELYETAAMLLIDKKGEDDV